MTKIAVLVSTRIDPVSARATRSLADSAAVAMALRIDPAPGLFTAGDMQKDVAQGYFALGAPVLTMLNDASPDAVAPALAEAVRGSSLVLAGARGESGLASGLLPYAVAHALQRPLIDNVIDLERDGANWIVRQALPRGARRRLRVSVPAVLVLSDKAPPATRHSYDASLAGRLATLPARADVTKAFGTPQWRVEPARRQLVPLVARTTQSGHARMSGATGGATTSRAGIVLRDGSIEDKAQALLAHLRAQSLIHF